MSVRPGRACALAAVLLSIALPAAARDPVPQTYDQAIRELAIEIGDRLSVLIRNRPPGPLTVAILPAMDTAMQLPCRPLSTDIERAFYDALQERKDRAGLSEVTFLLRQDLATGEYAVALDWAREGRETATVETIRVGAELGEIREANMTREGRAAVAIRTAELGAGAACVTFVALGLRCAVDEPVYVLDGPNLALGQDIVTLDPQTPFRVLASVAGGQGVLIAWEGGRGYLGRSTADLQDWLGTRGCRGALPPGLTSGGN